MRLPIGAAIMAATASVAMAEVDGGTSPDDGSVVELGAADTSEAIVQMGAQMAEPVAFPEVDPGTLPSIGRADTTAVDREDAVPE